MRYTNRLLLLLLLSVEKAQNDHKSNNWPNRRRTQMARRARRAREVTRGCKTHSMTYVGLPRLGSPRHGHSSASAAGHRRQTSRIQTLADR